MAKLKIGLLAYSSNTGLGYQTREFYKHIKCHKVLIADLFKFNQMPVDHSWCTEGRVSEGFPTNEDCEWLCEGCDLIFVCETPLNYYLFEYASKIGVKVVQQYNYEFLDYFRDPNLPKPTVLASPSMWGIEEVKKRGFAQTEYWPVPVNSGVEPREFDEVKTFVHIAGRPAAYDRNGTVSFITAAQMLGKKYNYRVYLQRPNDDKSKAHFIQIEQMISNGKSTLGDSLQVIEDTENNAEMYSEGEVLVLPRRYGGLCLPMWEALSAGMPVVMTNISPNYTNLPKEWLCEATITNSFKTTSYITVYDAFTEDLIARMEDVAGNIVENRKKALEIASFMRWEVQKQVYMERFKEVCKR